MSLKDFYDSINLEVVHDFLDTKQEEHLNLDFKTVNKSVMTKEDRGVYSKALSGFANSSGGVIVWGVEACKQGKDEYDVACGLPGVEDASLLVQKLNEHTGQCVSPIVEGVRHEAILTGVENRGFVKTFIPESDSGPHMALLGRDKHRYFKRSGDSSYPMEHYDITDMFGKRKRPVLNMTYSLHNFTSKSKRIRFILENSGRGTAKSPFVAILMSSTLAPLTHTTPGLPVFPGVHQRGWRFYGGSTGIALHPGVPVQIDEFSINNKAINSITEDAVLFEFRLSSEDMDLRDYTLEVPRRQLQIQP